MDKNSVCNGLIVGKIKRVLDGNEEKWALTTYGYFTTGTGTCTHLKPVIMKVMKNDIDPARVKIVQGAKIEDKKIYVNEKDNEEGGCSCNIF